MPADPMASRSSLTWTPCRDFSASASAADGVVAEDVLLHRDRGVRRVDRLQHGRIELVAVVVERDLIARHERHAGHPFDGGAEIGRADVEGGLERKGRRVARRRRMVEHERDGSEPERDRPQTELQRHDARREPELPRPHDGSQAIGPLRRAESFGLRWGEAFELALRHGAGQPAPRCGRPANGWHPSHEGIARGSQSMCRHGILVWAGTAGQAIRETPTAVDLDGRRRRRVRRLRPSRAPPCQSRSKLTSSGVVSPSRSSISTLNRRKRSSNISTVWRPTGSWST